MISLPIFRKKIIPKRCIYCRAFKPVPYAEHGGWCAYWKRKVEGNDYCSKFEPMR